MERKRRSSGPARRVQKQKLRKRHTGHVQDKLLRAVTVKQELQRMVDAVRSKLKLLRQDADREQDSLALRTMPFIKPLQRVVAESIKTFVPLSVKQEVKTEEQTAPQKKEEEEEEEEEGRKRADSSTQTDRPLIPEKYLERLTDPAYKDKMDFVYGVRTDGSGGTLIGDSKVTFTKAKLRIKDKTFDITRGLLELIFMKVPNRLVFNQNDLLQYKAILLLTNAHRQSYSADKHVNSNRGRKYTSVISPLFYPKQQPAAVSTPTSTRGDTSITTPASVNLPYSVSGSGVHIQKKFPTYNRNVNTIVDRLRLLVMSRSAGHTGHDFEIKRIVNTLRNNKVVA